MSLENVLLIAIGFAAGIAVVGVSMVIRRSRGHAGFSPDLMKAALEASLDEIRNELQQQSAAEAQAGEGRLRQVVGPLESSLARFESQIRELERSRQHGFGSLRQYLDEAIRGQTELRHQTHRLVGSLKSSNTRGRWGEISLRRAVELAGMVEHCDFEVQPQLEGTRLRPDLVVHLPAERLLVVDAKVPMKAYLAALEARNEEESEHQMAEHCRQILRHAASLSAKEYWTHLQRSPEFVLLFLPLESLLSSALSVRPELLEESIEQGVILVTPVSLIALLKAVEYGWKQDRLERNVDQVCQRARDLHSQVAHLAQHLSNLGKSLDQAVAAHNRVVTSVESGILAPIRDLSQWGVPTTERLGRPEPVRRRSKTPVGENSESASGSPEKDRFARPG